MNSNEKQYIHTLFETENFYELYQTHRNVINEMLSLDNQDDFEDFLENEDSIEENIFWLYYATIKGESLLINGYDQDVSLKVANFLKKQLPKDIFGTIQENLQNIYVDIDTDDNLKEKIDSCNKYLTNTTYFLQLDFDDTYYAGVYFLTVMSL